MNKNVKIALWVGGGLLLLTSVYMAVKKINQRNELIKGGTKEGDEIAQLIKKIDAAANE